MAKFMDKLYKYSAWLVIGLSLLAYFAYKVLSFEGDLSSTLSDYHTYIELLFVIFLNVNMINAAYDSGTAQGLASEEFELADKLNNKLIESVNNEMNEFRGYVKLLNKHELISVQEDYLFKIGDKKLNELSVKEIKIYQRLKPLRHNIYGFNLPLYYEITKNREVDYNASLKSNEGKKKKQLTKIFTGALFGGMTINMMINIENFGDAFTSLFVIMSGLAITFIMTIVPRIFKFKVAMPKKVILKNTLYNSYVSFKNGTHKLKSFNNDEPSV